MFRHHVIGLLIVLTASSVARAADDAQEWLKFFVGKWERTREIQEGNGPKVVEKATWSGKLAADGKALIATGKWDNGTKWVMIAGTIPKIVHFEQGLNSAGLRWSTDYSQVNATTLKGEMRGIVDGQATQGEITLTRTGDDSYEVKWQTKDTAGKTVQATASNKRLDRKSGKKKRQP